MWCRCGHVTLKTLRQRNFRNPPSGLAKGYSDPNGSKAFLRTLSTEGRGVHLCWEHSKHKGPKDMNSSPKDEDHLSSKSLLSRTLHPSRTHRVLHGFVRPCQQKFSCLHMMTHVRAEEQRRASALRREPQCQHHAPAPHPPLAPSCSNRHRQETSPRPDLQGYSG